MGTFEIVQKLCQKNGLSFRKVEMDIGLSNGYIKSLATSQPSAEKLQKIASYFDTSVDYLLTGKEPTYYTHPESAEIAQEIFENPDLRILFDASRDISPDDMKFLIDMAKRMKATNPDG